MHYNKMFMVPKEYKHLTYASQRRSFLQSVKTIGYDETIRQQTISVHSTDLDDTYVPLNYGYESSRNGFMERMNIVDLYNKEYIPTYTPDPRHFMSFPARSTTHYMMFVSKEVSSDDNNIGYIPVSDAFQTRSALLEYLVENEVETAFGLCGDLSYWTAVTENETEEGESRNLQVVYKSD